MPYYHVSEKFVHTFKFSGNSVLPAYPGFIVIKAPTDGTSLISVPIKSKVSFLARIADKIVENCVATTDKTSIGIRLNSSKQPHAPVWHRPLKIAPKKMENVP